MSSRALSEGKLPIGVLSPILDLMPQGKLLPSKRIGMDVGIVELRGPWIVSYSDFAIGKKASSGTKLILRIAQAFKKIGVESVIICPVVLFPVGATSGRIRRYLLAISKTATKLGITVAKGHTEVTSLVDKPVIVLTVFGSARRILQ